MCANRWAVTVPYTKYTVVIQSKHATDNSHKFVIKDIISSAVDWWPYYHHLC